MPLVAGPILILLALFVAGPIGLFVAGALWSLVFGEFATENADSTPPTDG